MSFKFVHSDWHCVHVSRSALGCCYLVHFVILSFYLFSICATHQRVKHLRVSIFQQLFLFTTSVWTTEGSTPIYFLQGSAFNENASHHEVCSPKSWSHFVVHFQLISLRSIVLKWAEKTRGVAVVYGSEVALATEPFPCYHGIERELVYEWLWWWSCRQDKIGRAVNIRLVGRFLGSC